LTAACGEAGQSLEGSRSAWSIANTRRIVGYAPQDDSEVVYADEIRELMLKRARQKMVQGEARGGKGSR
jgi:hypothetical protein